jgi:hypothetical protein
MRDPLKPLHDRRQQFAATLDDGQMLIEHASLTGRIDQDVGGLNRIGNVAVDTDAAPRQHRVGQQSVPMPPRHTVGFHLQHLDTPPVVQPVEPLAESRHGVGHQVREGFRSFRLEALESAGRNDAPDLPVMLPTAAQPPDPGANCSIVSSTGRV